MAKKPEKIDGPHACIHCGKRIPRRYIESHKKDCGHVDLTETLKKLKGKVAK